MPAFDPSTILELLGLPAEDSVPARLTRSEIDPESVFRVLLGRELDAPMSRRVEAALSEAGWFEPGALAASDLAELRQFLADERIRLGDVALAKLRRLAVWVDALRVEDGSTSIGEGVDDESLRESLRAVKGLGPATVDAILLRGLGRAAFPVERAGYRILARHGWVDAAAGYDEARAVVEDAADGDVAVLSALEAAFERVGREFCRPRAPRCERCKLLTLLPPNGPVHDEID